MSDVRSKMYGNRLSPLQIEGIVGDVAGGRYSDMELAAFLTASTANPLDRDEVVALSRAMVDVGDRLTWGPSRVMDKHCVGGLPGNRTTPIVVAIVAACGLLIPKTSSRAITSPSGTADAMETLAPVALSVEHIRRVVEREGGCIAWGGAVQLSPVDDVFIRVERALDLDSEGQLVASVLSKKIAAGATHVALDLPVGPSAKVRDEASFERLSDLLLAVAKGSGLVARIIRTDGCFPVGRGVGPALEARDVLSVLMNRQPEDLGERAVSLAAALLEMGGAAREGQGRKLAEAVLADGRAWTKFQAICEAQGGMREPPIAPYRHTIACMHGGVVSGANNRVLSKIAKLAGAPDAKAAGLSLHVAARTRVTAGQPLYTIHAQTPGELSYALDYAQTRTDAYTIGECDAALSLAVTR